MFRRALYKFDVKQCRIFSFSHCRRKGDLSRKAVNMVSRKESATVDQAYNHFLVLDFEATCEEGKKIQPVQEIIEFPVVQIDGSSLKEVGRFHRYVKPTERPYLTSFCTNLTGIVQECVDNSGGLSVVLEEFHDWLVQRNLVDLDGKKTCSWIVVTCGDWDLGVQLPQEAKYRGLPIRKYLTEWINLKKAFAEALGYFPNSLSVMLRDLQIEPVGRLHSGIDDVRNMCAIIKALALRGHIFLPTIPGVSATDPSRFKYFSQRLPRRRIQWKKGSPFKTKCL